MITSSDITSYASLHGSKEAVSCFSVKESMVRIHSVKWLSVGRQDSSSVVDRSNQLGLLSLLEAAILDLTTSFQS